MNNYRCFRAHELIECFDEEGDYMTHIIWPKLDLNPTQHRRKDLERHIRQCSSPPSSKFK